MVRCLDFDAQHAKIGGRLAIAVKFTVAWVHLYRCFYELLHLTWANDSADLPYVLMEIWGYPSNASPQRNKALLRAD